MEWIVETTISPRVTIQPGLILGRSLGTTKRRIITGPFGPYYLFIFIWIMEVLDQVGFLPSSVIVGYYHMISPDTNPPGDTMLQLRNAMGCCCARHIFCVWGQVVKLFPVSISFLTLVVAAFAKFKKFIAVSLKDSVYGFPPRFKNWRP